MDDETAMICETVRLSVFLTFDTDKVMAFKPSNCPSSHLSAHYQFMFDLEFKIL